MNSNLAVGVALFTSFALAACEKKPPPLCGGKGTQVEISGNHAHALELPDDALADGRGGMFPLKGGSHEHAVGLKAEEAQKLGAGQRAATRSSSVNAHAHEIEIRCKE